MGGASVPTGAVPTPCSPATHPPSGYMTNGVSANTTNVLNFDFGGSVYGAGNMIISNKTGASGGIDEFLDNQNTGAALCLRLTSRLATNGLDDDSKQRLRSGQRQLDHQLPWSVPVVGHGAEFNRRGFRCQEGGLTVVLKANSGTSTISGTMSLTSGGTITR